MNQEEADIAYMQAQTELLNAQTRATNTQAAAQERENKFIEEANHETVKLSNEVTVPLSNKSFVSMLSDALPGLPPHGYLRRITRLEARGQYVTITYEENKA